MDNKKVKDTQQGAKETRCCICGEIITDGECNPYPFGDNEKGERCCRKCYKETVLPAKRIDARLLMLDNIKGMFDAALVEELEDRRRNGEQGSHIRSTYTIEVGGIKYEVEKTLSRIN